MLIIYIVVQWNPGISINYAKGAVELDRYIEVSLYRDSRYNDIAVK